MALKALLDLAAQGSTDPDLAATLASRLARLDKRLTSPDRERLAEVANGVDITAITHGLVEASDPDATGNVLSVSLGRLSRRRRDQRRREGAGERGAEAADGQSRSKEHDSGLA